VTAAGILIRILILM